MNGYKTRWVVIVYLAVISGGLVFTAYTTYQDYFIRWGTKNELFTAFDAGVKAIGEYIAQIPQEESVYLSPTWGEHASLRLHSNQREDIRAYNGRHCFIFPQQTETPTSYIIVPHDDKNSLALLQSYYPQGQSVYEGTIGANDPYFTVYQIPSGVQVQFSAQVPMQANWDDQIELVGYDFAGNDLEPGAPVTINLYFKPLVDMSQNYIIFVHLWGEPDPESGNIIYGQQDREPCFQSYPTSFWQVGEVVRDTFSFSIAPEVKTGTYRLAVGIYRWPELTRLPLLESNLASEGDAVILGEVQIGDISP